METPCSYANAQRLEKVQEADDSEKLPDMTSTGSVTHLFMKKPNESVNRPVHDLPFSADGIREGKVYSPLRQVLLTALSDVHDLGYAPGELHENIVVNFPRLQEITSGCVLAVGEALIRLTFHCEPCRAVKKEGMSLKPLLHRRGVLGMFQNSGSIVVGDPVKVTTKREEYIPYDAMERVEWYLQKHQGPILASELLRQVGLAASYARALPALLKKMPSVLENKVIFKSRLK